MSGPPTGFRVGWGFDSHRLGGAPPLILGGVVVSETAGVSATSDGDLLAHAITDAILGAACLADLGEHFPSDDESQEGINSMVLLSRATAMARTAGWGVTHLDATVVAEEIRIAPYRDSIRESLAKAVATPVESVSVKATTTDGLGFTGRGEGLATMVVVTVAALT